jgi:hypothetical protein
MSSALRSRVLAALPFSLLLPALAAAQSSEFPGAADQDLADAYAEASQLYGVPEPLLRAVVDAESDAHMNPFPTRDGRWGLTGLVPGRTLDRAAELTGFSIDELTADPRANLLGGAAALAEIARTSGSLDETLFRWAAFDVPAAGWDYAAHIIDRLEPRAEYVRLAFPGGRGWMPDDRGASQDEPLEPKATPDYPGARWVGPACSYTGGRSASINFVVVHTCEGGFSGCWGWLVGCNDVSAHYVVSEAGEVVQGVEDHDTGWHVGCLNSQSIGIEHEGSATRPEDFTDAMYCASAQLTRWLCDNEGIPRDRSHVIGHNEANDLYCGGTHWDPGPGWDWTKYMDYVECGCGGCTPTRPIFDLRTEIADVAGQDRDFCTLYESGGIFDLNAGQTTTQRFYVTNNGDAVGRNIVVGLWVEEPYLRLRRWDIYDNWPTHTCGAEWCLNDANTHPSNPAHDDPGAAPLLYLYGLSPGETKMIEMTIEATGPSIGVADHPDVRLWVKHVDDFYEKNDFGSTDYNNVGGYQTYNGGDLRVWTETDVLAAEACGNGLDDDCDGTTDEECQPETDADAGTDHGGADDGSSGDGLRLDVPTFDAVDATTGGGEGDGCGCRAAAGRTSWWPAVLVVAWLARRRGSGR